VSEYAATVTHKTKQQVPLTAIAPGKWDPVSILNACSAACGRQSFDVDVATAKPTNSDGIDEVRIARIVGADGLRPYLSRQGQCRNKDYVVANPLKSHQRRLIAAGYVILDGECTIGP
jgi:hypothetical protein